MTYTAESYVVFGGDFTEAVTHAGTEGDDLLSGDTDANVMVSGQPCPDSTCACR